MDPEAFHNFCTFAFKFCLTVRAVLYHSCMRFQLSDRNGCIVRCCLLHLRPAA